MAEGQISCQPEENVEADREDAIDAKLLQQIGIVTANRFKDDRAGENNSRETDQQQEIIAGFVF